MSSLLKSYSSYMEACTDCGICIEVCPFYKITGNELYGGRAKLKAAYALYKGEELSEEEIKTLLLCTRCDQCNQMCPAQIPISEIVAAARGRLKELGKAPGKYLVIAKNIMEANSPMAAPPKDRLACLPEEFKPPEKAKYLYVPGCIASFRARDAVKAAVRLFMKLGLDFTVLGEREPCCGLFLSDIGMVEEAAKLAEANTKLFEETGAEYVITECPSCYDMFKRVYPRLYREPSYKVLHVVELLHQLLKEGKLHFKDGGKEEVIVYKDPCPLVRRHGITEQPREILKAIPGVKLIEYRENRSDAVCCGAPAGVKPLFPDLAAKLAEYLVNEAVELKASCIAVACTFCLYHIVGSLKEKLPIPVKTLSQIVLEHL